MENGSFASSEVGTSGDSFANNTGLSVQFLSTPSEVYQTASEAPHSMGPYWLTKRRDGRSRNWMIARYMPNERSVIYKSCSTTDLAQAVHKLHLYFEAFPPGFVIRAPSRPSTRVYFIQAENGPIKIGTTFDVGGRLASLRNMSPAALTLLCDIDGNKASETAYHRRSNPQDQSEETTLEHRHSRIGGSCALIEFGGRATRRSSGWAGSSPHSTASSLGRDEGCSRGPQQRRTPCRLIVNDGLGFGITRGVQGSP